MGQEAPINGQPIKAFSEERCKHYAPKKVALPVTESSFVQLGQGQCYVDVNMATVASIGLLRVSFELEALSIHVFYPDYLGFDIPLSWTGDYLVNGEPAKLNALYMPGELDSFHIHAKSRDSLVVTLPRQPFIETIAALRGLHTEEVQLKERELRLSNAAGAELRHRFAAILQAATTTPSRYSHEALSNEVVNLLINAYLQSQTQAPLRAIRLERPGRIVQLAEAHFMAANGKPVSLADLCAAAGVGKSVLYAAFNRVCGMAPLAFFQKRRLMQARELLITGNYERGRVKHAALSSGFTELGRFSVEYRQLFGESPSVTLSRPAMR